ncbi:hypothetical protein MMC12_002893 [Toensbergia leucococca]|nr:hypothetical protein [Toensbergia leucococca]
MASSIQAASQRLSEQDPQWPIKAYLRITCAAFAFLALRMYDMSTTLRRQNWIILMDHESGNWSRGTAYDPIMRSLLFNLLILAFVLVGRQGKDIHLGWYVGADLIIWALCVPAIILAADGGSLWYSQSALEHVKIPFEDCVVWHRWDSTCKSAAYCIGVLEIAMTVFLYLIFSIHLALFSINSALFAIAYPDINTKSKTTNPVFKTTDTRSNPPAPTPAITSLRLNYIATRAKSMTTRANAMTTWAQSMTTRANSIATRAQDMNTDTTTTGRDMDAKVKEMDVWAEDVKAWVEMVIRAEDLNRRVRAERV